MTNEDVYRETLMKIGNLLWEAVGPGGRSVEDVFEDIAEEIDVAGKTTREYLWQARD